MEIIDKDKKTYDEMIEKLILDFTEKESEEDYSSYNIDQFLTETQQLLTKYNSFINSNNIQSKSLSNNQIKQIQDNTELNLDEIPFDSFNNSIEFIDYLEYELPKLRSKNQKVLFLLKKYEEENKPTFSICDLSPQDELSLSVFREDKNFFGSMSYEDKIILSDNLGTIKFFSIKDKRLVRTLPNPIKNTKKLKVYAIDISDDGDIAFFGYQNGNIAIFDLEKNKCRTIFNDIHKTNVINIKIIEQIRQAKEKQYKILSSDISGNVFLTFVKKGLLGIGFSSKSNLFIKNNNFPFYMIYLLKFKENELKNNSLSKLNRAFILGNLEYMNLYTLSPNKNPEKIFNFDKPDYLKDYYISDCAFGLGIQPSSNELLEGDDAVMQILLLISWEKVIYLHVLPILKNSVTFPLLLGYYVNTAPIIRIGFLNLSSIYLIDKEGNFKILDTRKFNLGQVEIQKELNYPIVPKDNAKAELQKVLKFNGIMKQIYLRVNDMDKETYLYSILNNNTKDESSLCVLTDEQIYYQELIDYQKYLKDLQKSENWMELLILGINIYKGKMAALNGIPIKKVERKSTIGEYLQDLISQFLFTNAGTQQVLNNSKNNYFDPNQEKARIEKNMEITIEFCIEIDSVNYLLDKILKIYESKKYKDIFLAKLEPFILCDKMKKFDIAEDVILDLIKIYEGKKNLDELGQILIHLNIKSIDKPNIRQKIQNLFLLSPFIYICIYGEQQDYFKPVTFIFDKFITSKEIPEFKSYKESINEKKMALNDIKKSKQYIGHKLLWYIKKTLSKKKFPRFMENIDDESYCKSSTQITYWLLNDEIMQTLTDFDFEIYFDIISFIFGNKDERRGGYLIETLDENNDDPIKKEEALKILKPKETNKYNKENITPKDLVEYFIENMNSLLEKNRNKNIIQLYLNIFLVTIGKRINLEKKIKKDAVKFIIRNYHKYDNKKPDQQIITNNITEILEDKEFTSEDYNDILYSMNKYNFDDIRLLIYKKGDRYQDCIELFLDKKTTLSNKEENLFEFINMTFYNINLKQGNKTSKEYFKNIIIRNIDLIAAINIDKFELMITSWFSEEKKQVLDLLNKNKEIQLQYVELLVKKLIKEMTENQDFDLSELKEDEVKYIQSYLLLHIQLLCANKETNKIISFLKKCDLYPIDESIEICKKYEVTDGLVFLYKKIGCIDKALDVCLTLIKKLYNSLLLNLNSESFEENKNIVESSEFIKTCQDAINLLIESQKTFITGINSSAEKAISQEDEVKEHNKLWSTLLDCVYKITESCPKELKNLSDANDPRYNQKKDFEKIIQGQFQNLLMVMSRYVGIKYILDFVYRTNKNAKFSEFKPLLFEMLSSYDNQETVLNLLRNDLKRECNEYIHDLNTTKETGYDFEIDNCSCDVCNKLFNETLGINGKLLHYPCKHMEHLNCAARKQFCQICLEKEYKDNITKLKSGGDYIDDKIHKEFMKDYEEYKREMANKNQINVKKEKNEKKEKKEKKKVGNILTKKFRTLMNMDNNNKNKRSKMFFKGAEACQKLIEIALEEKNKVKK